MNSQWDLKLAYETERVKDSGCCSQMTPSCKSVVSYAIFNVSSTNSRKEEGTKPIHAFPQHAVSQQKQVFTNESRHTVRFKMTCAGSCSFTATT